MTTPIYVASVMNTIPSTTKRHRIQYTVVGGTRPHSGGKLPRSLSIVLLNRGGRPFKSGVFDELSEIGAAEIISVEGPGHSYDVENLARKYPEVRFVLLDESITVGERVNIGIEEAKSEFVFVLWNDLKLIAGFAERAFANMVSDPILCTVPIIQNQRRETVPTIPVPALYRKRLKILPTQASADREAALYPFEYCGMYRKEQFSLLGGYDYLLRNAHWQKLDFGFRAFMWGERIHCSTSFRLQYRGDSPAEDTSRDQSYKLFFLKNLAVRFNRDSGKLPPGKLPGYLLRSGGGLLSAYREFREVSRWVSLNQYRFRQDAKSVTELWEKPES